MKNQTFLPGLLVLILGVAAFVYSQQICGPPSKHSNGILGRVVTPGCEEVESSSIEPQKERPMKRDGVTRNNGGQRMSRDGRQMASDSMRKAGVSEETIRQWRILNIMPSYLDSPAAILGQSETLSLTAEQKSRLESIEQDARDRALKVLTSEQKEKLGTIPKQPVTMKELMNEIHQKMKMNMKTMMKQRRMDQPDQSTSSE